MEAINAKLKNLHQKIEAPKLALDEHEARWFAVYTKFKREKMVLRQLQDRGIETYLPLQSYTRRYTRKIKHIEIPLISCYIFTKITKQEYIPVLETPDVVHFVKMSKSLIAIPDVEMDIMRRVIGAQTEVDVQSGSFQAGDEVEIIGGNLTGLKGWLLEKENEKNFVIELENLGYSLRMSVSPQLLRKTGRKGTKMIPKVQSDFGFSLVG